MGSHIGNTRVLAALMWLGTSVALECLPVNHCACRMTDGSGVVDLSQLPLSQLLIADVSSSSLYIYQPCQPFTIGSDCQTHAGTVFCKSYLANGIQHSQSLGNESNAQFLVDLKGNVKIRYHQHTAPSSSAVDVTLVCTNSVTSFSLSRDQQEDNSDVSAVLEFQLQSPAVCPRNPSAVMPEAGEPRLSFLVLPTTHAHNRTTPPNQTPSPGEICHCETTKDLEIAVPVTLCVTLVVAIVVFVILLKTHTFQRRRYRPI